MGNTVFLYCYILYCRSVDVGCRSRLSTQIGLRELCTPPEDEKEESLDKSSRREALGKTWRDSTCLPRSLDALSGRVGQGETAGARMLPMYTGSAAGAVLLAVIALLALPTRCSTLLIGRFRAVGPHKTQRPEPPDLGLEEEREAVGWRTLPPARGARLEP